MTPLIPQEIYLIERYTSAEYFKKLRDAFAETVQAAEDALAEIMRTLPREYRRRPRWQQPDITWGGVVLPNFRDTLQMVEGAYLALLRGDLSAIEMAGNVNTAFAGQGRDYPCDWMPSAFLTRFMNGYVKSSTYAGNIAFTAFIGWIKGSLSTRYNADSRGPLNAPPSWPIYRLNPAVRVATDETVKVTGVYLPDADDSCAQFFYAGPPATSASVGYDPNTGQNIDEVDTVWTLVERVADGGGGVPGDDASSDAGVHLRISRSISALSRTYLPSPPAHQNQTQGRYALPRHSGENDDAAGWQTQPMLPAILVLLSLPATFFAIAWAALQPPVVAGVFYLASLTVWLIHCAWRHYVTKTPTLPIPGVLAALAPFSLSVSLGRRLFPLADGILQNAISVLVCLLAISLPGALHSRLERLRFLRDTETPSPPPLIAPPAPEIEWCNLPNGLRFRTTEGGEICMGGPVTSYHLFSNGIVLGTGALTLSADGRYAACDDLRHGKPVMLADLENGIVRNCEEDSEVQAIRAAGPQLSEVKHLLRRPGSVQYVRVHGLWVGPDWEIPPVRFIVPDLQGRTRLYMERRLDEAALQAADDPLAHLLKGDYTLSLDGEPLPVRALSPKGIVWSEDGDMLLVPALPTQPGTAGSHWLWRREGPSGWVDPLRWNVNDSLPSGDMRGVSAIDAEGYWAELNMNRPSDTGYPQRTLHLRFPSCFYGGAPREWVTGADERGRLVIRELAEAEARVRVRLSWGGRGDDATLESRPTPGTTPTTAVAHFTPQPWTGGGLRPYRVEAGAAAAKDVALFHLWSDCGRYVALQPHCSRAEAADRFFVLDTVTGRRMETGFRGCGLQLLGWACGELQVGIVVGKVPDIHFSFDPFAAVDPPPRPEADGSLLGEWLLTEGLRFRIDDGGEQLIGPLSKQVVLTRPPYPNAAFDFHYHAPSGGRSVFVFGARNEYQDDYDRAQCCRYQARAITSDGICLEELGVGMIWSEDGRYLVVTNRVPRGHPDYRDTAWKARLVDCDRRLIYSEISLGCMPIFETWSGDSIDYRQVGDDWWREDVKTLPARLPLADLLNGGPEALRYHEGFWLLAGNTWQPHWREAFALAYGDTSRR